MNFNSIIAKARAGADLDRAEVSLLLAAEDAGACHEMYSAADDLKRELWGERVTYVVNLNLNWTNHCVQRCGFCNFRRDADDPTAYRLTIDDCIAHVAKHTDLGITEVTIQGGLDANTTVEFYYDLIRELKKAFPHLHLHAYSPEEVFYIHERSGESITKIVDRLRECGVGSMPGTAAEILVDDVRRKLCAQKVMTAEWCDVVETAHRAGIRTTCTMMYGHIETIEDRAAHLLVLRDLQRRTGGFTEFVGLPFVAANAPIALRRKLVSPQAREALNVVAASRLLFRDELPHIQAVPWVKRGLDEAVRSVSCGADDLGGTLIEEQISRAAGACHGSYTPAAELRRRIETEGLRAVERTTLYGTREAKSLAAIETEQMTTVGMYG